MYLDENIYIGVKSPLKIINIFYCSEKFTFSFIIPEFLFRIKYTYICVCRKIIQNRVIGFLKAAVYIGTPKRIYSLPKARGRRSVAQRNRACIVLLSGWNGFTSKKVLKFVKCLETQKINPWRYFQITKNFLCIINGKLQLSVYNTWKVTTFCV